jgi:hypothetical protein
MALVLAACSSNSPSSTLEPATPTGKVDAEADVSVFVTRLVAVAKSCDTKKVAALWDDQGLVRLIEQRAPSKQAVLRVVSTLVPIGANKFCAWVGGANEVRFLRAHVVQGEPRAVLRKISDTSFGYYEVRVKQGVGRQVRLLDVYSHNNGTWISDEMADTLMAPSDVKDGATIGRVNALEKEGNHVDALAALDSLPEPVRNTRSIQDLRVAIAGRISLDVYGQASAERVRRLPDYKPTPFAAMNAATLRHDYDEALHQLDVLDTDVGGDPFLDAIRASVLLLRQGSGDLEAAAVRAERAAQAEPKLLVTQLTKLGIAMALSRWAIALATLEGIEINLGVTLAEDQLQRLPNAAGLFALPAYVEWRKRHP